jgi:hypothetical protein
MLLPLLTSCAFEYLHTKPLNPCHVIIRFQCIRCNNVRMNYTSQFMGDEGCEILSEIFANNRNLRSLDLRGCNIHADGNAQCFGFVMLLRKLCSKTRGMT